MVLKLQCSTSSPPVGALLTSKLVENPNDIEVEWGRETLLNISKNLAIDSNTGICRYLARTSASLYGSDPVENTEVDHWLSFSIGPISCNQEFLDAVSYLDKALGPITYLVGNQVTIADLCLWGTLLCSSNWNKLAEQHTQFKNVNRWFFHINSLEPVKTVLSSLPPDVVINPKKDAKNVERKDEGKFVELPDAKMGEVVVRFPPEASGFLHIGHAKAALLNQYYQESFKGKLIMRFDDTNPDKEKVDFEKVILEDLKLLDIKPDRFTHTSDYFDLMLDYCEKMLKDGKAYVDDTDPEVMKQEREQRTLSKNRNNSIEKNFKMWTEMKSGTEYGQKCCVRAKIDMGSDNGCMRDPTIYRCKNEPHPKTGSKYKVYPTYDFACPIVDSIEGVTHALRTMEYHDRDDQFYWFIDALGLRKPHIWEYSRLNMMNTVLSKRKLTWFVEQGIVDSWEDPRFPTVRGVLRRGMTVEGLRQFIIAQGSSRSVVQMEWDKIWAFNKKVIDPIAPRYTALQKGETVVVNISDAKENALTVPKHPKNISVGSKTVWTGPRVLIEKVDAQQLKEGKNATFINWGNVKIKNIHRNVSGDVVSIDAETDLTDTDYKKTLKLTWLAEVASAPFSEIEVLYYDHIITKPVLAKDEDFKSFINYDSKKVVNYIGDPDLSNLKVNDIIQLQRIGFFRCDRAAEQGKPLVLIHIPDGSTKPPSVAAADLSFKEKSSSSKGKLSEKSPLDESAPGSNVELIPLSNEELEQIAVQWSIDREHLIKQAVGKTISVGIVEEINGKIIDQGNKVRELKAQKADKAEIDAAVKLLLSLKADYKSATGSDWKPGTPLATPTKEVLKPPSFSAESDDLLVKIAEQGDIVRKLKAGKAEKTLVDVEVKTLLALKEKFKNLTGQDWKPGMVSPKKEEKVVDSNISNNLLQKIAEQGDKVRKLKSEKATKNEIDAEVKVLLSLKTEFKSVTGQEWKPGMAPIKSESTASVESHQPQSPVQPKTAESLLQKIAEQGDRIRQLKADKERKDIIEGEVKTLLALKAEYKNVTGEEWKPQGAVKQPQSKKQGDVGKKSNIIKEKTPVKEDKDGGPKKQTRLGIEATKEDNLPEWYSQVITKGELIEYYDISGCYILRPWAFAIWEAIQSYFDKEIKALGVQNCYFPMFVSKTVLEKEKTHIADFSPEVAWVTKSGDSDLAEHIAIRPTSETVMYPAFAKWIQSYRDLPLKLNQWNSVVRWEFKHPQPFIRTREFLWQEGHSAFATFEEANEEVLLILDFYAKIYTDLLAIPVIKGRKTEKEKFAGGNFTTTVEAYVSATGRGIQGATSHHLGQNFSKIFEIIYEDPETQEKKFIYQNSWGISTRTIGVMIMVHADNQGLVLPPRVAALQVVIVPCGITVNLPAAERENLTAKCKDLEKELAARGLRARFDHRDNYSPGWKFNHWELKGVPLRIELGPKDIQKQQIVAVRRDTGEKITLPANTAVNDIVKLLDTIHDNLLAKATHDLKTHLTLTKDWNEFCDALQKKNIIYSPFCGEIPCEDNIKKDSAREEESDSGAPSMGAKSLCTPFEQPKQVQDSDRCIHPACNKKPLNYTLFGRSY